MSPLSRSVYATEHPIAADDGRMLFSMVGVPDALALTDQVEAGLVLLDESAARQRAKRLGLRKTGTVGVLLRAKQEGLIDRLRPELDELRETSFWIDQALYRRVLEAVNEDLE